MLTLKKERKETNVNIFLPIKKAARHFDYGYPKQKIHTVVAFIVKHETVEQEKTIDHEHGDGVQITAPSNIQVSELSAFVFLSVK